MKREAFLRQLCGEARNSHLDFRGEKSAGKGSHYRVYVGGRFTTGQSGGTDSVPDPEDTQTTGIGMKRDYRFSVSLERDPDGGVLATFPDVPEAIAHGSDTAEALVQARGALAVALFGYLKEGRRLPSARRKARSFVAPQTTDVLKIAVVEAWMESGLSKSEFARLLGVDEKEARRILDPDAATKADRLEKALSVLGRKVHIAVEAA